MDISTEEFDVIRSKAFNFHSVPSIKIAELYKKTSPKLNYANIK